MKLTRRRSHHTLWWVHDRHRYCWIGFVNFNPSRTTFFTGCKRTVGPSCLVFPIRIQVVQESAWSVPPIASHETSTSHLVSPSYTTSVPRIIFKLEAKSTEERYKQAPLTRIAYLLFCPWMDHSKDCTCERSSKHNRRAVYVFRRTTTTGSGYSPFQKGIYHWCKVLG